MSDHALRESITELLIQPLDVLDPKSIDTIDVLEEMIDVIPAQNETSK